MARRNLFQPPPLPNTDSTGTTAGEQKSRFPSTGAMSGVKATLKDVASNAVREISVGVIQESGPNDRLSFTDADVSALAESIKTHGQQVPIMVRPLADKPGHYRIVYGRRRLRALRSLGIPAKALVRSLSDEEAILAQGQENTQRLDPSFIEKALFAAELAAGGYGQAVILDALAIDKPMLSRMAKVARSVPKSVIELIGSAHGIGRRRWEELADQLSSNGIDLEQIATTLELETAKNSEERFGLISQAVNQAFGPKVADRPTPPPTLSIKLGDGTALAEVKETARALTFKLSKSETPEFAQWMRNNAEAELTRLYVAWQSEQKPD
jgi:ParB family transcriptional regulator, chromosome partitioning protein